MLQMLLKCSTGDEEVVNVAETEMSAVKNLADKPLDRLGGTPQPAWQIRIVV